MNSLSFQQVLSVWVPSSLAQDAPAAGQTTATTQAPASTDAAAPPQQPSPLMSMAPLALMFGVIYFLILRPQQKKMKEHQAALEKLKHGDEVVTQAGIFGTIREISDKVVTLEVDKNVRLKVLKSQVATTVRGDAPKEVSKT